MEAHYASQLLDIVLSWNYWDVEERLSQVSYVSARGGGDERQGVAEWLSSCPHSALPFAVGFPHW